MKMFRTTPGGGIHPDRRSPWAAVVAGALFLTGFTPSAAKEAGPKPNVKLVVRVFRVPSPQSFEALVLDGRGRPATFQASGDVTSSFPQATLFFETDLAANASESAIASAVLDRVSFGNPGMPPKKVRFEEFKALELDLGPDGKPAEARFEESRGEARTSNYWVRAEMLSAEKGKALIRLRFDAGWSAMGGSLVVGMSEDVVSAPFEVPESRLLLIGGAASGKVYWLAVTFIGKS